jgi:hypothetical protein
MIIKNCLVCGKEFGTYPVLIKSIDKIGKVCYARHNLKNKFRQTARFGRASDFWGLKCVK